MHLEFDTASGNKRLDTRKVGRINLKHLSYCSAWLREQNNIQRGINEAPGYLSFRRPAVNRERVHKDRLNSARDVNDTYRKIGKRWKRRVTQWRGRDSTPGMARCCTMQRQAEIEDRGAAGVHQTRLMTGVGAIQKIIKNN